VTKTMHVKNNVASYVLHKPINGADLILTYRYRVKDASGSTRQALRAQARRSTSSGITAVGLIARPSAAGRPE